MGGVGGLFRASRTSLNERASVRVHELESVCEHRNLKHGNVGTWERGVGWSVELVVLLLKQQSWLRMDGLRT